MNPECLTVKDWLWLILFVCVHVISKIGARGVNGIFQPPYYKDTNEYIVFAELIVPILPGYQ
jgi:hypothetical protein